MAWRRSGALLLAGGAAFAATSTALALNDNYSPRWIHDRLPSRAEQLHRLSQGTAANPYDVLIIGGGATGTGCAVDAVTRGLRTAMVEREDFAAGTSSRSTKLVHGGVRYLEKAFKDLDFGQFKLVFEALHERGVLLRNVPYLSNPLPIMMPCYKWYEAPYFWAGLRAYDLIAGSEGLEWCRYLTPSQALSRFPTLCSHRRDGAALKGAIVYHDGQFNDSRLAVVLACTASAAGATVLNHAEVTRLLKDGEGKVVGAVVRDVLAGKDQAVYARTIINAAGPFSDEVRQLSEVSLQGGGSFGGGGGARPDCRAGAAGPNAPKMIMPSSGVHVTLPDYYSPEAVGMIVPKTKDGRVVFMLPWLEQTIAGTTDSSTEVTMRPQPTEEEIQFILDAISDYLTVKVRRSDVQSAWSGIRPLALDPNASDGYYPALFTEVAQNYTVPHRPGAIDTRVAKYLVAAYGDRAGEVTRIAEQRRLGKRIVRGYPILEAEVVYAVHSEYCETPEDFIARRTRLAFLDKLACEQALPKVVELMAGEKGWSRRRAAAELQRALAFLKTFDAEATR
ncbi:hypothetical protein CHLNCDRAFT_136099 [Chlorella variabilis]|uniref:Glycerol-3-phosphate dehydrogenase n=1 Tax=Chlorella variabilis TaxID=554065 RepID=E1ZJR3_CHLVA|nr:hypothetical protein CHLNCDRAFT_136099 [Chlorella variabilis]EFN54037.1 hypothetical protein CHLNCDRAFT_136099 [Chlorella variabilis]|eukprot:XP_005846139.1 hypothetical protein CHLNCDRAFT_136099 [Chlorella variabilis]